MPALSLNCFRMAAMVVWIFMSTVATAGIADLSLEVVFDDIDSGVSFQQQGEFRVIITNNGPDAAGTLSTSARPNDIFSDFIELGDNGPEVSFSIDTSISQDCGFGAIAVDPRPGEPPRFIYFFNTGIIQPNMSVTCHGIYMVNFHTGSRSYDWFASGDMNDSDPVFLNNFAPVTFGIAPRQVPGIGFLGMLILMVSCVVFGNKRMSRNQQL